MNLQGHGLRNREGITPSNIHAWETASSYAVSGNSTWRTLREQGNEGGTDLQRTWTDGVVAASDAGETSVCRTCDYLRWSDIFWKHIGISAGRRTVSMGNNGSDGWRLMGKHRLRMMGPVTPLGGMAMIAG